jgi:ACS family glucarate transporter-like MFS transporter
MPAHTLPTNEPGRSLYVDQRAGSERTLVILMIIVSAVNYFDRSILGVAAPALIRELGISETAMGTIFSAFLVSYTVLMTPAGWLADRMGAARVMAFAAVGWGFFTIATPMAAWAGMAASIAFLWMLGVRFFLGAVSAPLYPACASLTSSNIPVHRAARTQSLVLSASALGSAVAPLLFSPLIQSVGWKLAFLVAGLCTWAVGLAWILKRKSYTTKSPENTSRIRKHSYFALLKNRRLLTLSASYFCLNYFEYIFFYWTYYYFGEVLHVGQSLTAIATTSIMLGMVVLGPAGGWLADKLSVTRGLQRGRRAVVVGALTMSAILLFAGAGGFGTVATILLLTLAFGCASMSEGPFWASAISVAKDDAGAAGGLMNTIGNIGGILAPVLTPLIASRFGWQAALWAGAAIILIGMFAWLVMPMPDEIESSR